MWEKRKQRIRGSDGGMRLAASDPEGHSWKDRKTSNTCELANTHNNANNFNVNLCNFQPVELVDLLFSALSLVLIISYSYRRGGGVSGGRGEGGGTGTPLLSSPVPPLDSSPNDS